MSRSPTANAFLTHNLTPGHSRWDLSLCPLFFVVALAFLGACTPHSAGSSQRLDGRWDGSVGFGGRTNPLRIDFYGDAGDWSALAGRPDAPDLAAPLTNIRYDDPRLAFELSEGEGRLAFEGTRTGDVIAGTARDGDVELSLELRRTGGAPARPFEEEPARFINGETTLDGTLLLPPGAGPHPAVVLIHGTGRQTRDEWRSVGLAFVRAGIAALLYDKREVGQDPSGMDLVDLEDLAGDALAAVGWLKAHGGIRADRIGLWGISQGGWVAPLAAARSPDVVFIIAVSAPGVSYAEVNLIAVGNRLRSRDFSETDIADAQAAIRQLDDFMRRGDDAEATATMLAEARAQSWFAASTLPTDLPTETERQTWLRWRILDWDPGSAWERVHVPVLLLYGERDAIVPVDPSLERIRAALGRAGNARLTAKVFPDADHVLALPSHDGAEGQPRLAPGYLESMTGWARAQSGSAP